MSKHVKPADIFKLHTSGAPYSTHPGSVVIAPQAHMILPSHGSAWSGATIAYIMIASIILGVFLWAASRPDKNNQTDDLLIKTIIFSAYLFVGLSLSMSFSYHNNTMYSWIIVFGLLIPIVIVLFWGVYRYNVNDEESVMVPKKA